MGECSICLESTYPPLVKLYCGHSFHKHCISRWFDKNNTCPVCRKIFINKFVATNNKAHPFEKNKFYLISLFQYHMVIKEYLKKPYTFSYRELVKLKPKKDSLELNFVGRDYKINYDVKLEKKEYINIMNLTIKQHLHNMLSERMLW